jgi:hypothetical protein
MGEDQIDALGVRGVEGEALFDVRGGLLMADVNIISSKRLWTGYILSGLTAVFLLMTPS